MATPYLLHPASSFPYRNKMSLLVGLLSLTTNEANLLHSPLDIKEDHIRPSSEESLLGNDGLLHSILSPPTDAEKDKKSNIATQENGESFFDAVDSLFLDSIGYSSVKGHDGEYNQYDGLIQVTEGGPDCKGGANSRYHALVCWLWNAHVSLPDEQFHEDFFTISVNELTCTNFEVTSMSSSSKNSDPNIEKAHPSIQIDLKGISATCTGKYSLSGLSSGNIVASMSSSGGPLHLQLDVSSQPLNLTKTLTNGHELERNIVNGERPSFTLDESKDSLPFPSRVTMSSCKTSFDVHDLQFTGSISAKVIGLFSGIISKQVTTALNEAVCPLIKSNSESMINKALGQARGYLGNLVQKTSTPTTEHFISKFGLSSEEDYRTGDASEMDTKTLNMKPRYPPLAKEQSLVRWDTDMPLLKRILSGVNYFVSKHMNEGLILKILQRLNTWNLASSADCRDCGFFFKGVNGLVKALTKGSGYVEIMIPETILNFHRNHTFSIPKYGDIVFTARSVKVAGLDNFTELTLFSPNGDNMISTAVSSDVGFNMSILMDIEVRPTKDGAFRGDSLHESFEVQFNTSDFHFSSLSHFMLDREMFTKLNVGSFIYGSYTEFNNTKNLLNCVLEALTSVVFTNMQGRANLHSMHLMPVVPASEATSIVSLEDNIDALINNAVQMLLSEYPETTSEALTLIVQKPLLNFVNSLFEKVITDTKKYPLHCVNVDIPKRPKSSLEFDNSKAFILFDNVVNRESTITAANAFIECVDDVITAEKLFSGHFFNYTLGDVNVDFHDLSYENVNSLHELKLLQPEIDHYHLTNGLTYAMCSEGDTSCGMTSLSFAVDLVHLKHGHVGSIDVHVKVKNLQLSGGTELKFDMSWFPYLQISDLLARPQCLSIPATDFKFYNFNASVEMLEVNMDVTLSNGNNEPQSFVYKTNDSIALGTITSTLMSKGAMILQKVLGNATVSEINQASQTCSTKSNPHRTQQHPPNGGVIFTSLLLVMAFVAGNAWLFLRGFGKKQETTIGNGSLEQHDLGNEELDVAREPEFTSMTEPLLDDQDEMNEPLEVDAVAPRKFPLASSSSLMFHPTIHPAVTYGFPAVLFSAFVLFLSSNFTVGASVDLLVTRANGEHFSSLINIYSFSLSSTLREMFRAGVYFLMLLIWFCSGVWPYVKLALMMFSWLASTRRLQPIQREKILYLLDALGKFSLIDAYVLVLMMVAFRYELEVPEVGALNVFVTPKYGFYSFLFATIVSLISGHGMLFLHRRSMLPAIPVYSGRHESLAKHIFDDKHGRGLVKLTKKFRRTIILVLFLAFVLICVGVNLKSFHFEFTGVAGTASGDSRIREFSLVSIGQHIPQSGQDPSSFGIHWIQTCYFFFALVMPLVCLVSLVVLFIYPMTMERQQIVFVVAEISNAWSAIEVFVIAICASLVEISPFSESMVDRHCSLLDKILSGWSGGNGDEFTHCFGVKSSIDGSSAVLIIGVALNSLLISTLHRFAHHALWERIEREDRPDATEDETKNVRECVLSHTFVYQLRQSRFGKFMFEDVSFGPHSEYEIDFENVAEDEEQEGNFWSEWRKIVSVI